MVKEKTLGSHTDSSQACVLPPSSDKLGVVGRESESLEINATQRRGRGNPNLNEDRKPGEYVRGASSVTLLALGVAGTV